MERKFVQVIVNNKSNNTDREYTYLVKDIHRDSLDIGSKVIVPFGQGNRPVEAFVVNIIDEINYELSKLKAIKKIVEDETFLSKELIELCRWMKDKYMCQFIDAIQCVTPTGTSLKNQSIINLNRQYQDICISEFSECSSKEIEIIQILQNHNNVTEDMLKKFLGSDLNNKFIKELIRKKIIVIEEKFKSNVNPLLKKMIIISDDKDINEIMQNIGKNAKKQKEVMNFLLQHGPVEWTVLKKILNVSYTTIEALESKGYITSFEEEKYRDPYDFLNSIQTSSPLNLTDEQQGIINRIKPLILRSMYEKFLIHGVTGSGKTEVYMNLIESVLEKSKEAIVLVPEIALAAQMIERFKGRFGNVVAVLHSKLSLGERFDQWKRIKKGEVKIVIGARSAVFAPFSNLGIIIIDEEHESTYKSEYNPKYHTIEVAEYRCKYNQALLLLGSATPSIESYKKSMDKVYNKVEMYRRFNSNPLPNIKVIDMRTEIKRGNRSIFSEELYKGVIDSLNSNKQIILFLNRRGYSTFVSCRNCGYVAKCPNCEISLTYHSHTHNLSCHYCGFSCNPPNTCPTCSSKYIKYFGIGTEKLEQLTKNSFPDARIARLDLDTTSRKGVMDNILQQFKKDNIDILIGTQMIAKGLDFPNVNLVGVISADTSLNLPDFRSAEKTFQLITQVAGRAGRGNTVGNVIVQTYEPEHYAIVSAKSYDFISFYEQEIKLRKEFRYPPFTQLFSILFTGEEESTVRQCSNYFAEKMTKRIHEIQLNPAETIFGPQQAPISKVKKRHRWQIIIKSELVDQNKIKGIINDIRKECMKVNMFSQVNLNLDINPYNML